ncbi:hypothetical protein K5X82_06510 [Halosquirtibacter xylanolyticus]|uniref:hypothetical protein n=1 Tax=Halosquirtibacter xylanolyticus TaxID=3374599 RepID=UPI003748AF3A|nr:hypothetical protein K5X82_06510 [Prolixibacteraceae bacterium]
MKNDIYLMATIPQWTIFLGIISFFWGVIEKKIKYAKIGNYLFIATTIIAVASLLFGNFGEIKTPTDTGAIMKLLCLGNILLGVFASSNLWVQMKKNKNNKWLSFATFIVAISIFMMYYNVLQGAFEK